MSTFPNYGHQAEYFQAFVYGFCEGSGQAIDSLIGPDFKLLDTAAGLISPTLRRGDYPDSASLSAGLLAVLKDRSSWVPAPVFGDVPDGVFGPSDPLDMRFQEMRRGQGEWYVGQGPGGHYFESGQLESYGERSDWLRLHADDLPPNSIVRIEVPDHAAPSPPQIDISHV